MDPVIVLQAATLGTLVVGGVLAIGKALGKLDRLGQQVNGGFKENKEDHKQIFGRLQEHDGEIRDIKGQLN